MRVCQVFLSHSAHFRSLFEPDIGRRIDGNWRRETIDSRVSGIGVSHMGRRLAWLGGMTRKFWADRQARYRRPTNFMR
jgi:hypothetical protein